MDGKLLFISNQLILPLVVSISSGNPLAVVQIPEIAGPRAAIIVERAR